MPTFKDDRQYLRDLQFLRNYGISRRQMLKLGAGGAGLLLAGGVPVGFVRSASAQDAITGGPLEVAVMYEEGPWFEHAKSIGDSLEADYPGTKVKYTFGNTASDSARALRWQNGDPLDVDLARWSNQAPPTWDWPNNGFLADLKSAVDEPLTDGAVWGDTFTAAAKSFAIDTRADTTTQGAWWGIPYELVLMLVQYNVQVFEDMGITPPKTWDEFQTVCETIKEKGADSGVRPICVSGPTNVYLGHWWDRLTQRIVGRDAVDACVYGDAKLADNPGFLTAAQELAKLPQNGWLMEGFEGADFTTAQALFFQGKAAMIHMGSWLSAEMKDVIPADFRLGVFDFPSYDGGAGDQTAMFGTAQIFSIASPEKSTSHEVNVPLATEYLRRWTSKENQAKQAENLSMIPTVVDVAPPSNPVGIDAAIAQSATSDMIIYYYGIHWDTALTAAWYDPVQALFLGKATPEEMVAQIDKNLEEYRSLAQTGG